MAEFINEARKPDELIDDLLQAICLCHFSRTAYNSKLGEQVFESYRKEEETGLAFARHFKFEFDKTNVLDNPDEYFVKIKDTKYQFDIMSINEFSFGRMRGSILVRNKVPTFDNYATLYCKGPWDGFREYMQKEELDVMNHLQKLNSEKGFRSVIFKIFFFFLFWSYVYSNIYHFVI